MSIEKVLHALVEQETLSETDAEKVMNAIMQGEATPSQIAAVVALMRTRGETVDELTGFARSMRAHALQIEHGLPGVIDTCGTGGDGASTFNISTGAALTAASLGLKVAKHGNRSVSSRSGSADVLEMLKLPVETNPEEAVKALHESGMTFLFAPLYHEAMKHAAVPRKEIGFRTIFNLLGPLTNPAQAEAQVIGVFDRMYGRKMAEALQRLGTKRALLVTGADGLDELTISTKTYVTEVAGDNVFEYEVTPEALGATTAPLEAVQAADQKASAEILDHAFHSRADRAVQDILAINAGAALYVGGAARTLAEGYELSARALKDGTTAAYVEQLRKKAGNINAY
ncbi:anthranilate phosphoribosyltransferase [Salsuginibacillus halophilus]|uniref:Anthranilate phosphoribosyltransferase n=1 Tax=Salsuginibacillus halophilus TaxID=517424 RepID=A0A2P8HW89_9BACI|nr:anthranilate phosphoribosyltransferase [Salsuginibacillus halophilus]PSL50499.1 anthranilate phosphoribosyltransferase [Salsuginibacillus halophilus]